MEVVQLVEEELEVEVEDGPLVLREEKVVGTMEWVEIEVEQEEAGQQEEVAEEMEEEWEGSLVFIREE